MTGVYEGEMAKRDKGIYVGNSVTDIIQPYCLIVNTTNQPKVLSKGYILY